METNNEMLGTPSPAASRTITGLAELPGKTLLDERALAGMFRVTTRTIRRMIARFELPPPVMLAGKSTWIVERVLAHIEDRADRAARHAEHQARRIETLSLR